MNSKHTIISVSLVLGIGIAFAGSAIAQGMMAGTGQGMMGPCMMCPMMGGMMQGGHSMMGSGVMGPNLMRGSIGGMSALFGSHVVPAMNYPWMTCAAISLRNLIVSATSG